VLPGKAIAVVQINKEWWAIRLLKPKSNMNKFNRDLLVLFKEELLNPKAIEHQVELLHELLYSVERVDNLITAHEVINLNKFKIYSEENVLRQTLGLKEMKPFVFLNNKN
jgi:hypothetical protein